MKRVLKVNSCSNCREVHPVWKGLFLAAQLSVICLKTFMLNINHNNSVFPALNINSRSMFENLLKLFFPCLQQLYHLQCFLSSSEGGGKHGAAQVHNSVLLKWESDLDGMLRCVVWHIIEGTDALTWSVQQTAQSSFQGLHKTHSSSLGRSFNMKDIDVRNICTLDTSVCFGQQWLKKMLCLYDIEAGDFIGWCPACAYSPWGLHYDGVTHLTSSLRFLKLQRFHFLNMWCLSHLACKYLNQCVSSALIRGWKHVLFKLQWVNHPHIWGWLADSGHDRFHCQTNFRL